MMPYLNVYSAPALAFKVTQPLTAVTLDKTKTTVFDLELDVYHVYKNDNLNERMTYWYTLDFDENDEFEFDIRMLPNFKEIYEHADLLQYALDHKLMRFCNSILTKPPKD